MTVFKEYASYYNLLYRDKDYSSEVEYIYSFIEKYHPGAESILNLGCGTGNHDVLFYNKGFKILGIDLSEQMIEIAKKKRVSSKLEFLCSDATKYHSEKKFDIILSLFHVINYQTSEESLNEFFKVASVNLHQNGLFIFDSWYGPAVLNDLPKYKSKEIEDQSLSIKRVTTPILHVNKNIAQIDFDISIREKASNIYSQIHETHLMRFLFNPEVEALAKKNGFEILEFNKWMGTESPDINSWYVFYCLRKI
jgi:SAM-dependent methyltransferase